MQMKSKLEFNCLHSLGGFNGLKRQNDVSPFDPAEQKLSLEHYSWNGTATPGQTRSTTHQIHASSVRRKWWRSSFGTSHIARF